MVVAGEESHSRGPLQVSKSSAQCVVVCGIIPVPEPPGPHFQTTVSPALTAVSKGCPQGWGPAGSQNQLFPTLTVTVAAVAASP